MRVYEWKNEKGEVKHTPSPDTPPTEPGEWKRVYSVGIGSVSGAGGSPGRPAKNPSS